MTRGVFITSTGTGAGKTFVTRGLARTLREAGSKVAALKPLETGCQPDALDAQALATACEEPSLASLAGFYRVAPPVAPFAATLLGEAPPQLEGLVEQIRIIERCFDPVLVEGAGGLLVPLDERRDQSDLARTLAFPLLVIAANRLGVLSHVFALVEAARLRQLMIVAVVLTEPDRAPDASTSTNAEVLRTRLSSIPVLHFPHTADRDADLARAARDAGLLHVLGWNA